MQATQTGGALQGLRVIDASRVLAGPSAARYWATMAPKSSR